MSFLQEVKFGDLLRKRIVTETTYNSGRKVKEDGYLSGLGVNHKCSCRDVLSLGEVFERNWVKQKDSMGSETQYLEGLGTYDNLTYNTLIITTQRKKNRFGNYVRIHELDISAGPHGESGKIIRFPEGGTIRDVKKKAAEIIVDSYKSGKWYFYLRDASDGEGCSKCAKSESILFDETWGES